MGHVRGNRPVVCLETGERFESASAAARHIGTTPNAVSQAAAKGHAAGGLHFYLADEPRPPEGFFKSREMRPVVCLETGERFESMRAAARHIGATPNAVSQAVAKGHAARGLHFRSADEKSALHAHGMEDAARLEAAIAALEDEVRGLREAMCRVERTMVRTGIPRARRGRRRP